MEVSHINFENGATIDHISSNLWAADFNGFLFSQNMHNRYYSGEIKISQKNIPIYVELLTANYLLLKLELILPYNKAAIDN
jgi:hypothetical protein